MKKLPSQPGRFVLGTPKIWIYLFCITPLISKIQAKNPPVYIFGFIQGTAEKQDALPSLQLYNPSYLGVDVKVTQFMPSSKTVSTLFLKSRGIKTFDLRKGLTISSPWTIERKSVEITSPVDIIVIALYRAPGTGDMQLVNPVEHLDRHYVAMPHCTSSYASCQIVVVATADDTFVKFRFPRHLWNISSEIIDGLFCTRLSAHYLFRIQADDLEGVVISANASISVFTGENMTTNGNLHKDYTATEVVNYWGKEFIVVKHTKDLRDIVKIIGSSNGTELQIITDCDSKALYSSLNEFQIKTKNLICPYMLIKSNFPVQVAQLPSQYNGDFGLFYVTPVDYYSNKCIVHTVKEPGIELTCKITLISKESSKLGLLMNGAALSTTSKWTSVVQTDKVYTRLKVQAKTAYTFTHKNGNVFGGSVVCNTRYQTLATSLRPSFDQTFYQPLILDLSALQCFKNQSTVDNQTLTTGLLIDPTTKSAEVTSTNLKGTTPAEDVTTPSDDVTTPSDDVTTPSDDVTTPSDDVTTPSDDMTTPSDDITTLSDGFITSSEDVTTPSDDVTTSSDDVTTSSDDVTTQSEDITTTSEDLTTPSDITTLLEDMTTPSEVLTTETADYTTKQASVTSLPNDVTSESVSVTKQVHDVTKQVHDVTTAAVDVTLPSDAVTTKSADITTESVNTKSVTDAVDVTTDCVKSYPAFADVTSGRNPPTTYNSTESSRQCTWVCRSHRHIDIEVLRVDKLKTVLWIRRHTSAIDNRISAICMGSVAILVLVAIFVMLVLADTIAPCKVMCRRQANSFSFL